VRRAGIGSYPRIPKAADPPWSTADAHSESSFAHSCEQIGEPRARKQPASHHVGSQDSFKEGRREIQEKGLLGGACEQPSQRAYVIK